MKKFQDTEDTLHQPFKVELYTVVAVIFFILSALVVKFIQPNQAASFHKEIFQTDRISYIKNNQPVALQDGNYNLAMPAGGTFVNGIAPMMLIEVDNEYYPLNIADDSILPRQGRQLPARILFGFTSPHASNTLTYDEKKSDNPAADYKRKAFYYLCVHDGYGEVKRIYKYQ